MEGLLGCRARWSAFNEPLGLPVSVECTVNSRIESFHDAVSLAGDASSFIGDLLGVEIRIDAKPSWEFVGSSFNLYSFRAYCPQSTHGVLRVVEYGGYALNISGALPGACAERSLPRERGFNLEDVRLRSAPAVEGSSPGQRDIRRFVVYSVEGIPRTQLDTWQLDIVGSVEEPLSLTYDDLKKLSRRVKGDFHCVTGWSLRERVWDAVPLQLLLETAGLSRSARWLAGVSAGGYAAIVPIEEARRGYVALAVDGVELDVKHGFPARLYFPELYGWKHVKWLTKIVVLSEYTDGYWEALGYHERGRVAFNERFKVRNPEIARLGRLTGSARMLPPRES